MELAHRCEPMRNERSGEVVNVLSLFPAGLLVVILLSLGLTRFVPVLYGVALAAMLTLVGLVVVIRSRWITARRLTAAVLLPLGGIVFLYGVSGLVDHRLVVTAVIGLLTFALFAKYGAMPLEFYRDWILTHPRLRPETIRAGVEHGPLRPTLWVLGVALGIAIVVPRYSTTLAMLLLAGLCIAVCWRRLGSKRQVAHAADALGHYLTYGRDDQGAPGVWRPPLTHVHRRRGFLVLLGSIFFTLGFGLTLFVPGDILRRPLTEALTASALDSALFRSALDGARRPIDWSKAPPPFPANSPRPSPPSVVPGAELKGWQLDQDERAERLNERGRSLAGRAGAEDDRFRKSYASEIKAEFMRSEIGDRPHTWFFSLAAATIRGEVLLLWMFPVAFGLALLLPNLVLLAVYADAMSRLYELRRAVEGDEHNSGLDHDQSRTEWDWRVDRVSQSKHAAREPLFGSQVYEADHLFMGVEPAAGFPVLLHRPLLNQHCYIVGETGSGKTSLAVMPILIQLLRQHFDPSRDNGARDEPPIVIIDLKGDPALFHTIRHECDQRRKRHGVTDPEDPRYAFRFFTPEAGQDSHSFNPFASMDSKRRSPMQLCELILDSLALAHGEGYGRSYYTRRNRMMLYEALQDPAKPRSFEDLYEVLQKLARREGAADVFELAATVQSLSRYKNLASDNAAQPESSTIHMPTALEQRQVLYFWLPAALESVSVREIAKLALYSLLSASIDRQRDGAEPREIYLFIDEFQRIAAENFRIILEQARSFGIRAILANQSISDLKTPDADLRPTVRTNTRVKIQFSVSDPSEMQDLCTVSGEELAVTKSYAWRLEQRGLVAKLGEPATPEGADWLLSGMTESTILKTRLTTGDIIRTSDHPQEYFLHVSQGSGYTQFGGAPIPVQTRWPIPYSLYQQRAQEPWPTLHKRTTKKSGVQQESPQAIDNAAQSEFLRRSRAALEKVYDEIERRYGPMPMGDQQ
jgi:hypothetical protein